MKLKANAVAMRKVPNHSQNNQMWPNSSQIDPNNAQTRSSKVEGHGIGGSLEEGTPEKACHAWEVADVWASCAKEALLENRFLTSIFYFQHRFLTDVETSDVNIINVNIGLKTDVNIHYTTSIFTKTDVI